MKNIKHIISSLCLVACASTYDPDCRTDVDCAPDQICNYGQCRTQTTKMELDNGDLLAYGRTNEAGKIAFHFVTHDGTSDLEILTRDSQGQILASSRVSVYHDNLQDLLLLTVDYRNEFFETRIFKAKKKDALELTLTPFQSYDYSSAEFEYERWFLDEWVLTRWEDYGCFTESTRIVSNSLFFADYQQRELTAYSGSAESIQQSLAPKQCAGLRTFGLYHQPVESMDAEFNVQYVECLDLNQLRQCNQRE